MCYNISILVYSITGGLSMDLNVINKLNNMSIEELYSWIASRTYSGKELEAFIKGKEMVDKLSEFSINDSSNKVMVGLIAYSLYKIKGGK